MRLAVKLLGVLWSVAGALVLASSVTAIWLWHAAALQVKGGYPPNALVILHAIPYAAPLFVANALMGLGALVTGVGVYRLRARGRGAALALSAFAAVVLTAVTFFWWVSGSGLSATILPLALALTPFVLTLLVLTREPVRSLFARARPVANTSLERPD